MVWLITTLGQIHNLLDLFLLLILSATDASHSNALNEVSWSNEEQKGCDGGGRKRFALQRFVSSLCGVLRGIRSLIVQLRFSLSLTLTHTHTLTLSHTHRDARTRTLLHSRMMGCLWAVMFWCQSIISRECFYTLWRITKAPFFADCLHLRFYSKRKNYFCVR